VAGDTVTVHVGTLGNVTVQTRAELALASPLTTLGAVVLITRTSRFSVPQETFSLKNAVVLQALNPNESLPTGEVNGPVGPNHLPVTDVVVQMKASVPLVTVSTKRDAGAVAVNAVPAAEPLLVHVVAEAGAAGTKAVRASTPRTNVMNIFMDSGLFPVT
jgi:hypothetical protein